jgi:hypothetical protein
VHALDHVLRPWSLVSLLSTMSRSLRLKAKEDWPSRRPRRILADGTRLEADCRSSRDAITRGAILDGSVPPLGRVATFWRRGRGGDCGETQPPRRGAEASCAWRVKILLLASKGNSAEAVHILGQMGPFLKSAHASGALAVVAKHTPSATDIKDLNGTIRDASGALIAGAVATTANEQTGLRRPYRSNALGF